ncbi:MAG: VCBS repeat-containing protein, partial [Candidatus Cloacimonetes bacterium]|nr:VCBS repeat-containing protein [Candidatus Cloacimonadota bacterium]
KYLLIPFLLGALCLGAISTVDFQWLLDTEQFSILHKHGGKVEELLGGSESDIRLALQYARRAADPQLELRCRERLALDHHSLEDALAWFRLADQARLDSQAFDKFRQRAVAEFSSAEEQIVLDHYLYGTSEEDFLLEVRHLRGYNPLIEDLARERIDAISVERSDSLALDLIESFEEDFPLSEWGQVAYYYKLYHLSNTGDFASLAERIEAEGFLSDVHLYISALYMLGPSFRRSRQDNTLVLNQALYMLDSALKDYSHENSVRVLYDLYSPSQWESRLRLTRLKAEYYSLLAELGLYGDEEDLSALIPAPAVVLYPLLVEIQALEIADNDRGDQAERHYWQGRIESLCDSDFYLLRAARSFSKSLILGSPRKKYDEACLLALEHLRVKLGVKSGLMDWLRSLSRYRGIIFEDHPFPGQSYTRVAIGDYDNDGFNDLLFNGSALYRNDQGRDFIPVSDSLNLSQLDANGGLWADFNRDGLLDLTTISHNVDGLGEALMKNQDKTRFVKVNERAGDIDDRFPTEGAAWIDICQAGYPSLYAANYEKWQARPGYPDRFWYNRRGYFEDQSSEQGFLAPDYSREPGLAGRGVAPADFDNDGIQEILVSNYRLNRNFCWDLRDSLWVDVAALTGVSGKYKEGYYGHSIGADWGDYDNDGDLDLFIANLAHPRYIDISDVSQLLRNDGLGSKVIAADTLWYWQFTDVTKEAGITYDELHSDPLWLDADNDGWLDLYITSVYENDRSYLYKNNGDGTFTDVTFLAGARVFNGWGNATADLDRDGLTDLVVGSGNGARILFNRTPSPFGAVYVKPVWKGDGVVLLRDPAVFPDHPNSPAFGTRVGAVLRRPDGSEYFLIRELSSAKGTTSQSSQELHFGLGGAELLHIGIIDHAQAQN